MLWTRLICKLVRLFTLKETRSLPIVFDIIQWSKRKCLYAVLDKEDHLKRFTLVGTSVVSINSMDVGDSYIHLNEYKRHWSFELFFDKKAFCSFLFFAGKLNLWANEKSCLGLFSPSRFWLHQFDFFCSRLSFSKTFE